MVQIAYLLLCHKDPDAIAARARSLAAAGDRVAIHLDGRAPEADFARLRQALAGMEEVAFPRRRLRCGWGEWSLVAATLELLETALERFPAATHFHLISGDCAPIKTAEHIHAVLAREDADRIECEDYFASDWIKTGMKAERLIYRHVFNERRSRRLFYAALGLQKRLGLARAIPPGLRMRIGSQWWCLRRATVERILAFRQDRPEVIGFFRTTWIPDETFFQTLVPHLVPRAEIRGRPPTFLMFTDYGMPATFYNDHLDLLLAQEGFFARKISPEAARLRARLGALYGEKGVSFAISGEGKRLHAYLTGRGRGGRRFAPRAWERSARLSRDQELLILVSKKWHVGKRLAGAIRATTGIPTVEYLFNEEETALPDLGGIEKSLAKRGRHRRAFVRLLFDHFAADRLLICMDPGMVEAMRDLAGERARVRLLQMDCAIDDAYLVGHARRVGLLGAEAGAAAAARVLPSLRADLDHEADALAAAGFRRLHRISERRGAAENAGPLGAFLSITAAEAEGLAGMPDLFAD